MFKSRKFILFLVCLVALITLSILDQPVDGIIALYGTYCVGNVGTKFTQNKGDK